ncbi:TRAD1 protein, partial [Turnix velox]|nr:TRAD1 protein [Turnix velox]
EQLEREQKAYSPLYEESDAELDYLLALTLQNENNPPSNTAAGIPTDFWDNYYAEESTPSASLTKPDNSDIFYDELTMLPCEFCEELYPAEDLVLHQTGCNPASAFASFSKRSSSPTPRQYDDLHTLGTKNWRSFSSSQPWVVEAEGDIMIPCEFCGIQLEEETLFHHQHHCDLRPASPTDGFLTPLLPPLQAKGERRPSPELARRRTRHQGV